MKLQINGVELERSFKFSGGECQIRLPLNLSNCDEFFIRTFITSSDKLMELLLTADALSRKYDNPKITAYISYMPYARQDRVCYKGEAFSLDMVVNMLTSSPISDIRIDDFHSGTYKLPNCFHNKHVKDLIYFNNTPDIDYFVSPDNGARDKVMECGVKYHLDVIACDKVRNPENGVIESIQIIDFNTDRISGSNLMIIDDICDGGYTFTLLAKELKKYNPASLTLYVTHGIFSKGREVLTESGIDNIITINDFDIEEEQ